MLNGLIAATLLIAFDWLLVGRLANFYSNFEYRYWPLPAVRVASIIGMAAATFAVIYLGPGQPLWLTLVLLAPLAFWGWAMLADVSKQRRSYVAPTRSDSEYGG